MQANPIPMRATLPTVFHITQWQARNGGDIVRVADFCGAGAGTSVGVPP